MRTKENLRWYTYDHRLLTVKEIEDTHLANIIKHIKQYNRFYEPETLAIMETEAKDRGLTQAFLERSQIPYKDQDGNWMLWSDEAEKPVKVG